MTAHASWPRPVEPDVQIAILGAGVSGIGMGMALKRSGRTSFIIFEKADDIGGTWRDNHYPGCACDVPSNLYSYSTEPNPNWSRLYSGQSEILNYLRACTGKYGLLAHIRFGTEVIRLVFDEANALWRITARNGEAVTARYVVSGMGLLSRPAVPQFEGSETFRGTSFHSANWNHSYDLTGKRVAVVGTGASAVQFIPHVARKAAHLTVFQRTPPWVLPKLDRPVKPWEKALFRALPFTQYLFRGAVYCMMEMGAVGFTRRTRMMQPLERMARRYLERVVPDPALRDKLTPDYTIGCKRILISNDYYPALTRPNVSLVTEPIVRIVPEGVQTAGGAVHPVDAIIFGTGFAVKDMLRPTEVIGRGGRLLNAEWNDGAEAYLGTTVSGYPNLFFLMGPNTGLGHSSMIYMIESQIRYVLDSMAYMERRGVPCLDVKPDVQRAYNAELQERIGHTVWHSGCRSWYITEDGRNPTTWPGFTFSFRFRTRRLKPSDYEAVYPVRGAQAA